MTYIPSIQFIQVLVLLLMQRVLLIKADENPHNDYHSIMP